MRNYHDITFLYLLNTIHYALKAILKKTLRGAFSSSTPKAPIHPKPLSQNPQALADLSDQDDRLPITALSTSVYTIENVKNRNWAVLINENDRSDVIAGNSAHKDAGEKVTSANFYE